MTKYERLLARRDIPGRPITLSEKFNTLKETEDIRYLLASMEPMDKDYTETSLSEARRVYKYLEGFSQIRIQGSVMTNTHIRYHSDIDILTMTNVFVSYDVLPHGVSRFTGDVIQTLKDLRSKSRETIVGEFPRVKIHDKDRAIGLSGGSLLRNVDLVTTDWYNTDAYMQTGEEKDRGVYVLDVKTASRILNKPFLHQHLLNDKNRITGDGLGRAIRMLKTLKVDANTSINISSYDLCALVWNIESNLLPGFPNSSFVLAQNVETQLYNWINDVQQLESLMVPNQTRKIVDPEGTSVDEIRRVWYELHQLLGRIRKEGKKLDRDFATVGETIYQL